MKNRPSRSLVLFALAASACSRQTSNTPGEPGPRPIPNLTDPVPPYTGPEVRAETSLAGTWKILADGQAERDIAVPGAWDMLGVSASHAVYSRALSVPEEWRGRRVLLDFAAVNFDARVLVNDREVGSHRGILKPFSVDLTDALTFGGENVVKVNVTSHDTLGPKPVFPIGHLFPGHYRGIVWEVGLRAVPAVHVDDAFVQPSVRKGAITVDYTIVNPTDAAVEGRLWALAQAEPAKSLGGQEIRLEPGVNTVRFEAAWPDARPWFPDDPFLYVLETQLEVDGTVIDVHHQRFGFREVWIEGDQYRLNGVRMNLRGESSNRNNQWIAVDGLVDGEERYFGPTRASATIRRWKELNFNVVRFHQAPAAPHILRACDELGFLVLNESTIYSKEAVPDHDPQYVQNALDFIPAWIRSTRNHPSIVVNVVENEMWLWGRRFTIPEILSWGEAVKASDPTRPRMYEGGWDLRPSHGDPNGEPGEAEIFSYHYAAGGGVNPGGFEHDWPADDDYYDYAAEMKRRSSPNKPVSHGEFLWGDIGRSLPEAHRMMAIATRAMRYHDYADVRPYQMNHLWVDPAHMMGGINGYEPDEAIRELEINSFAAVAAFDVGYDRLGTNPAPPALAAGRPETRTIVVYNDEWHDKAVTLAWELTQNGTRVAGEEVAREIELGAHLEIPIELPVPSTAGPIELDLKTRKGGVERFHEVKRFVVQ